MLCWALPSFAELCWALLKFIKLVGLTVACPGLCWVLLCVAFCFWFCCFGCCCFLLLLPLPCFSCLPLLRLAFSCFPLLVKAFTALIHFRASRSLLRQVSQVGLVGAFFAYFFESFVNIDFDTIFLRFWMGLGGQNASQNQFLESFLGCLFGTIILEPFFDVC